jgi:hypothetical protein
MVRDNSLTDHDATPWAAHGVRLPEVLFTAVECGDGYFHCSPARLANDSERVQLA